MKYISTRNNWQESESKDVIRMGMVPDGGLFVPQKYPTVSLQDLRTDFTYRDCAYTIMKKYLTDYSDNELKKIIKTSYSVNFRSEDTAPLTCYDKTTGILELWHGPTAAFKDLALQCMPRLLVHALDSNKEPVNVMILVATSGDTGKAALEGFKNIPGTRIITFYPEDGVSTIQKKQMVTTDGINTRAIGVMGNFDDCQTAVKNVFQDKHLREKAKQKGYIFSSANSINWGRLVPQVVYYYWAYIQCVKQNMITMGDRINVCVPTGNFGNILASYYANKMGLPIRRFICASNINNILTDFINTGCYDIRRKFHTTVSPSMDILISSNLERLIFDLLGQKGEKVNQCYDMLKKQQSFTIPRDPLKKMQERFYGDYASEEDTFHTIASVFNQKGYLLDTHTAVGFHVLKKYREKTKDITPTILTATANPYKFPIAVYYALTGDKITDDFKALNRLTQKTGIPVHPSLKGIEQKKVINTDIINTEKIKTYIEEFL
jgi:threonine synthase